MSNAIEKKTIPEGENLTVWFPDAKVKEKLSELAGQLKTSSSAVVYELVQKILPVIEKHKDKREISLDGVKVNV